ncbi:response regulator transcription factor [Agromyces sp. Soil535]|uniref:response regulator n=1 Tax=Agromyces sp. Soil535 TaxID=1736390 RepID=UPI0006F47869|nr:response regulator transcription factor [Agromyces sp. Soil535]KRE30204.1 LuxR family transcriptional regulator [Agromyces sp. Soil535]
MTARPTGIRIAIVDDQALVRTGFRMVLEAEPDFSVVGEAGDGAAAIELARSTAIDVMLMDVRMPVVDGIAATAAVTAAERAPRVIVLTTFDLDEYAFAAIRAGASGFLLKDVRPHELVAAIRTVHSGDATLSPRITRRMIELFAGELPAMPGAARPASAMLDTLTPREREILVAVAEGLNNAELAARFHVSESTVKTHVGRILQKLDARDRVHLVILAYEHGLLSSHGPSSEQGPSDDRR